MCSIILFNQGGNWGAEMKWLAQGLSVKQALAWELQFKPFNTNLVSFNCTTCWCLLGSNLFWSKTVVKVMLDLLLSFQMLCFRTHFPLSHLPGAHHSIPWTIQPPYGTIPQDSRLFLSSLFPSSLPLSQNLGNLYLICSGNKWVKSVIMHDEDS